MLPYVQQEIHKKIRLSRVIYLPVEATAGKPDAPPTDLDYSEVA